MYSADFLGVFVGNEELPTSELLDEWDANDFFKIDGNNSITPYVDQQDDLMYTKPDSTLSAERVELVLIDGNVADSQQLIDDLSSDGNTKVIVHLLDTDADGIEQVSEILSLYTDLDAVHLVSHGSDSGLQIGSSWLDADSLDEYQQAISGWQGALDEDADLLIYGCDLGASIEGTGLLSMLSLLTGADVAASTDITGHADLGGDWDLEFEAGDIETSVVFSSQLQQNWLSTLPITTRETEDTDGDGQIDRIKITANTSLNDDFTDLTITVAGYALDPDNPYTTDVAGDKVFYVNLVESGTVDTGATPIVTVVANTLLKAGGTISTDGGIVATDATSPVIIASETADLNGDGFIDAIHLTFSEAISDATVTANDFDVAGVVGEGFVSTTNGDTIDDNDIYVTFTDAVLDTQATPDITYTADGVTDPNVEDLSANLLPDTGSWWDANWQNRTEITFSGNDAAGTENLDNFTVLVSLTAAEVDFAKIQAGGADIRFVDADGVTLLDYQIETWDDGAQTATVWVKVPRIDMASTTDSIYLYYNNAAATDASSTAAWDANYQGVWHLNEGTGVTQVDATANTNDATAVNSPVASTGKVGGALTFASMDELDIAADASLDLSTYSNWTISAWVKPTDYTGLKWPLVYSYGYYDVSLGLTVLEGTDGLIENWTNDTVTLFSNTTTTLGQWNHIAITRDATTTTFYLNGVAVGTGASTTINTSGLASYIGNPGAGFADEQFLGQIDEVRVSAGATATASRSAEWMAAQYSSMNLTLSSYGAEESFTVDGVNDAPTLTATAINPVFPTGGAAVDLFSGVAINTVEAGQTIEAMTIEVTNVVDGAGANEFLVIDGENIALSNATAGVTGANGYGYSVSLAGTTATITLTTTGASVANAQTLVDGLAYTNDSLLPSGTSRVATLTSIADSGGILNGGVDTTLLAIASTVNPNDAPTLAATALNPIFGDKTNPTYLGILMSTDQSVASSGAPGLSSWDAGDILEFEATSLDPAAGLTDGLFASSFSLSPFALDAATDIASLQYVKSDITIGGTTTIDLKAGDVLFATRAAETLDGLSVTRNDLVVFRPDILGDYSAGSFFILLESPAASGFHAVSLVTEDTLVGDVTLTAGSFLLGHAGGGTHHQIRLYTPDNVGAGNTTGLLEVLIDESALLAGQIQGLDLIERDMVVGGQNLSAGQILVTVKGGGTFGNNSLVATGNDIFALTVATTDKGSAASDFSAELIVDGSDIGLDTAAEEIAAFSVQTKASDLFDNITLDTVESGQTIEEIKFTVTNVTNGIDEVIFIDGESVSLTDLNSGTTTNNSYGFSVVVIGSTATVTITTTGTSIIDAEYLINHLAYDNTNANPDIANRVVTITSIKDSGGTEIGGVDTGLPNIASTVTVFSVNDAPVLTATGLNPTFTEGGALEDLFSGVTIGTVEAGQTIEELKFSVTNVMDGADEIVSIDGENITLTDTNSGTTLANGFGYSVSLAGTTATVTLTTTGTPVANAQTLIDGLAYQNTSTTLTTSDRVVTLTSIKDSGGVANSGVDTAALAVISTINVDPSTQTASLRLHYGQGTDPVLQNRDWDYNANTWSAETATISTGSDIKWTINQLNPDRHEELVIVLSDSGAGTELDMTRWDGNSWTVDWTSTSITSANSDTRGFDITYEQSSGDAMVVYSNNTANPVFRTWDGTSWSAEQSVFASAPGTGTVLWVEIESRPETDEIALVYADSNNDLHAVIWDGDSWTETATETTLEVSLQAINYRSFDLAYENSGDLMVAWGIGTNLDYATKAAGSTTWTAGTAFNIVNGNVALVDLAAEPGGDRIAMMVFDVDLGTERLGLSMWNGASWQNTSEYDNTFPHVETDGFGESWASVGWVGTSGEAVVVYSDADSGVINWGNWTSGTGWTIQADVTAPGAGHLRSVQMETYSDRNELMTVFSDANGALWAATYDGSTWSITNAGAALETGLSDHKTVAFSFDLSGSANPIAATDAYVVNEDTTLNVAAPGLLANDTDADSDPLSIFDYTKPTNGSVTVNADGSFAYTPNANFSGSDSFNYVVTDDNDGMVHYWKLDGNGTDSVGGSNGTVTGTTPVVGPYGDAMSFDEVDDKIVVPDFTYTDDHTISFRFKVDDVSGTMYQYIYSQGALGTPNSINVHIGELGSEMAGILRTTLLDSNDIADQTALDIDINTLIGDGQWHTYTLTVESGVGSKLYIDGVLGNSSVQGGDSFNPGTDLYLSTRVDNPVDRFYGGQLDSVQVFDRNLSAAQALDLHTGDSSLGTVNITVNPANDAPTLTATAVNPAFTEGGADADLFSGITINTVEAGQTVEELEFTVTNVTDGTGTNEFIVIDGENVALFDTNSGITVANSYGYSVSLVGTTATVTLTTAGTSVANAQTLVDGLAYTNDSTNPTTANRVATLTSVKDSGGTLNGGVDTAVLSNASTVTVNAVNDAPTLTATGVNPAFTEGGVIADLFSGITINTLEAGQTIEELKFTVTNVADGSGANEFVVIDGEIVALSDTNSGITVANGYGYSVSLVGTTATVTLTTAGTSVANAQTLVDGLAYTNDSTNPTTANRVATLTSVKDSGGTLNGGVDTTALSIASTVTVNAANDAPTLTATAVNPIFTKGGADADLFSGITVNTVEPGETIEELKFTVTNVTDGTGANEFIVIDGENIALSDTNSGITVANSYGYSVSLVGTSATVTLTTTGTTVANAQILVDGLAYTNDSVNPTVASRVVTLTSVKDSGGTLNGGVDTTVLSTGSTVAVNNVNSAPTLTATSVNPAFTEGGADADLFSGITINTVEAGQTVEELKFTVTNVADGSGANEFVVIDGENVALFDTNSGITGANSYGYSVSLIGTTATVTLTTAGTSVADAQTLVDGLAYSNDSANPTTANRVATLTTIKDSGGVANGGVDTTVISIASTVTVNAANDAPTLTATAVNPLFTEGGADADVFSSITINTVEPGETIEELKFTVSNVTDGTGANEFMVIDGENIALLDTNSGITIANSYGYSVTLVGTTATVTLTTTGTTVANAQILVDGLAYTNDSVNPTVASRVVTLTSVKDSGGTLNGGVDTTVLSTGSTVAVNNVNSAPTLTATAVSPAFTEGGADADLFSGITINTVEAGQTVEELEFTVTNVADGSGANEFVAIDGENVALFDTNSGITGANSYGYSVSLIGTTATVTLTTAGTSVANAQTLVDGLAYSNDSANPTTANRVATLISVKDSGGTLNGGVDTTALSIASTVTVNAANDAPTLMAAAVNPAFSEGGVNSDLFSGITINTIEAGQTIEELKFTVTNVVDGNGANEFVVIDGENVALTNANSGTTVASSYGYSVSLVGTTATVTLTTAGTTVANAQTLADGLAYTNDSTNPTTANRVATLVSVKDSGGTLNGGVDTSLLSIGSTVTVNAVNDAPTLTATAVSPAFTEGGAYADLFSGITINTVEAGQTVEELEFTVTNVIDGTGANEFVVIDGENVALFDTNSGITGANSYGYSVSLVGTTATVTLTTAGTSVANAQTLVDGLAYSNDSANPTTANRVATLTTIKDSGGVANGGVDTTALSIASTVTVNAANDAPTLTATAVNPAFTEGGVNSDLFSGITINTIEAGQAIEELKFTVTNVVDGNGANEFVIIDGDNVALSDTNSGVTIANSYGYSVSLVGTTATVTLTTAGTTVANAQTLVDGLAYTNDSTNPTTANRVATLTSIKDSGGTLNGGVDTSVLSIGSTVTVNAVNDAPTLTATAVNPFFTAGGADADLFSGITINTIEAGQTIEELTFTVTNVVDGSGVNELIVIDGQSVALSNANSGATLANGYGYSVSLTGTTATVTLTTTGTTIANAQTLVDGLAYTNDSANPTIVNRVATLTSVKDSGGVANGGLDTGILSTGSTVNVNASNSAPALTATGVNPTFVEGGAAADLFSAITIDTIEAGQTVDELKFEVTNIVDGNGANEFILIDGENVALTDLNSGTTVANSYGYNVSLAGTTATVTLTTTGTSVANAQILIDGLAYTNNSDDPNTASRDVTLTSIKDSGGTINGGIDTTLVSFSSTASLTPVNDAPTLTATGTNSAFIEGGGRVDLFSGVTIDTIEAGLTIEELKFEVTNVVDGSGANELILIDGESVTLSDANSGTTLANGYGYSVSLVGTTATVTLTTSGTSVDNAQTLVDGLAYSNASASPTIANRIATLTSIKDSGGTLNGGVDASNLSAASTVTLVQLNSSDPQFSDTTPDSEENPVTEIPFENKPEEAAAPASDTGSEQSEPVVEEEEVEEEEETETEAEQLASVDLLDILDVYKQEISSSEEYGYIDIGTDYGEIVREKNAIKLNEKVLDRFINLDSLKINQIELKNAQLIELKEVVRSDSFNDSLNRLGDNIDDSLNEQVTQSQLGVASVAGVAIGVSTGILSQVLRAGSLLAGFLTVVPLWRQFDPLPILSAVDDDEDSSDEDDDKNEKSKRDQEDQVEEIFSRSAKEDT